MSYFPEPSLRLLSDLFDPIETFRVLRRFSKQEQQKDRSFSRESPVRFLRLLWKGSTVMSSLERLDRIEPSSPLLTVPTFFHMVSKYLIKNKSLRAQDGLCRVQMYKKSVGKGGLSKNWFIFIRVQIMFPASYTYNPGVVLDPVTMTPMITHGGNITVNPLGVPMRPEQKVWQKMFIKNIPQECTNEIMLRLLNEFGNIKNFKRSADNRGRLLPFCYFDLETGEEIMRIRRIFNNIRMLDQVLELKISPETENFIKEWMNMQREEWKKKLMAPGTSSNEAKQYETIELYHTRDDKKYRQRVDDTLRQINVEVRKLANERMREDERKEHPREKEREKAKRKAAEQLERTFLQKEEQVLKRQREKQREYRKEKEREREREKQRLRRLEKQVNLEEEELEKRLHRFLTAERRRQLQAEEDEDLEVMMEENPPLPEEAITVQQPQPVKRVKVVAQQDIQLGAQKVEAVLVEAPKAAVESQERPKELKKNELFEGYEQLYEEKQAKESIQLNIPELRVEEVDKQEEQRREAAVRELAKRVPQNKMELWQFQIDWEKLSKSTVLERNIRPWLEEMSNEYMGGVEEKFIALVEKKLLSKSHPDKIIKILKQLLDDDSEEFVIKLWKKLVLEYLKLQNDLL